MGITRVQLMPERFDSARIDDDPAYWDALSARVAAAAASRRRDPSPFEWLGTSVGGWVIASVLIAAMCALVLLRSSGTIPRTAAADWVETLAPADDLGKTILVRDRPPEVEALVLGAVNRGGK